MVYIFWVDNSKITYKELFISNKDLNNHINTLHAALSDYGFLNKDPQKSRSDYSYHAHQLYLLLIAPILEGQKDVKKLIIIPDGGLALIPFETFLVTPPKDKENYDEFHYLMRDYNISYNYAATLLLENIKQKNKNNGQMLSMAAQYGAASDSILSSLRLPSYQRLRLALSPLPAAIEEVEVLKKQFRGFFAINEQASEKVFKEKAPQYAILHLAMHGLLDKSEPILSSLAFSEDGDSIENNFLQAYEISKMELNADLVVLSACETGFGRFETGNGTASLARAFMYAGVPSLVVSLWQVNDAGTSIIMQFFYQNLAKGMDKAEALRQAKLSYIEHVGSVSLDTLHATSLHAHPAFWSPFILIGDSQPINLAVKSSGTLWWLIGAGLLLLASILLIFILQRRKRG